MKMNSGILILFFFFFLFEEFQLTVELIFLFHPLSINFYVKSHLLALIHLELSRIKYSSAFKMSMII